MREAYPAYKTFIWSLGTTSFRMNNFHRNVEKQLMLLDEFWNIPKNKNVQWKSNNAIQREYYLFMLAKKFVSGDISNDAAKCAKTARQKTSGLVDIGVLDEQRRLTEVGRRLLEMAKEQDFGVDNDFGIPKDSYVYWRQLLKTSNCINNEYVRPYLVMGILLNNCDDYLTDDEFKYLAPLCINEDTTKQVIEAIAKIRAGNMSIDTAILNILFSKDNYIEARRIFVESIKGNDDIMAAGMNRDGARHDACYASLYFLLKKIYVENTPFNTIQTALKNATKAIKNFPGIAWRKMLYIDTRKCDMLKTNVFDTTKNDPKQFDKVFFETLHLNKAKATLRDYMDLNRRYLNITDSMLFENGKITFTPVFLSYFKTMASQFFDKVYVKDNNKAKDLTLEEIDPRLAFEEQAVSIDFGERHNVEIKNIDEMYDYVEQEKYAKFRKIIDEQYSNSNIINILTKIKSRASDDEIIAMFGGEADVPTIFEYIVGIAWYKISDYHGKILDYMKLSLNTELLPRTHAGGGESDIVYKYEATDVYPAHDLLIECTLMTGTTQRHGEMEPVTRHLMNHILDENENSYCVFMTNNLHNSVVSDFRTRKFAMTQRDIDHYVESMNIVPCDIDILEAFLRKNTKYEKIYPVFMDAYDSTEPNALRWLEDKVRKPVNSL